MAMQNKIISVNVGGEVYVTTSSTLRSLPNTLLADLMDPTMSLDEAMGEVELTFQDNRFNEGFIDSDDHCKKERCSVKTEESSSLNDDPFQNNETKYRSKYIYFTDTSRHVFTCRWPSSSQSPIDPGPVSDTAAQSINTSGRHDTPAVISVKPCDPGDGQHVVNRKQHTIDLPHPHLSHQDSFSIINLPSTKTADLYVDRNPLLMPYILDAYRTGQLHLPTNICSLSIKAELEFWKIPEDLISECCWRNFQDGLNNMSIVKQITSSLHDPYDDPAVQARLSRLGKLWLTLEKPRYSSAAMIWCIIYYLAILVSCIVFMLHTVQDSLTLKPEYEERFEVHYNTSSSLFFLAPMMTVVQPIAIIEYALLIFFTLEFAVRLFACPEKVAFLRKGHNILDMVILVLTWTRWGVDYVFTQHAEDHNMLRSYVHNFITCFQCTRCLRAFHLLKHMVSFKVMSLSLRASIQELLLLVVVVSSMVLMFGTVMFLAEILSTDFENSRAIFENVPVAVWWAIVTMTTVGYGDFVPKTTAGYVVGSICGLSGILLLAMPIAILASNFSDYLDNIKSRDQRIRRKRLIKKIKSLETASGSKNRGTREVSNRAMDRSVRNGGDGKQTDNDGGDLQDIMECTDTFNPVPTGQYEVSTC